MASKTFKYAAIALNVLERLLGSRFSVNGIDKLPNQPVLFVANHFTRSETFFVPYIINKYTKHQVRCLADASLYHGMLGKFLNSAGTISTKNPNRDNIILQDLISGDYNWMIYPEGSMIKSKEIRREEGFVNYTPKRVGRVRTGSAILAIKSEIYRKELIKAFKDNDMTKLKDLKKKIGVSYHESLKEKQTHIVPVNITYYPIRPGDNRIKSLVGKFIKTMPKRVVEELEIEGNLLLDAEINISFGNPINIADYIKQELGFLLQIPIIKEETKTNLLLKYFKHRLTVDFMQKIYCDIQINLDHIFSAVLYHLPKEHISIDHLKRIIYVSAIMIQGCGKYRLNHSALEKNLVKMFIDEVNEGFDSVFNLAKEQGLITYDDGVRITIDRSHFYKKSDFHEIRLENTLSVVANEFLLLQTASEIIKKNVKVNDKRLKKTVFEEIRERDLDRYEKDYEAYYDKQFTKDLSIGMPFFLDSNAKTVARVQKIGVLLCHGYKSSPKEVEALAQFLNGFGFRVYAIRLRGHGTAPINMKDVTWQDWYDDVQRGYAALNNICSKIVIIGFSTGGLLTLLSSANKTKDLTCIIAINSALKLRDIKAKMVPGINLWNDMLEKVNIKKGQLEYVDDKPENPKINYSRNYLKGVEELGDLMDQCDKNLKKVSSPALIIQAKNDPIVSPKSGKLIYQKISSQNKFLLEPDFSNHVIINGENREEVFESIREFLYNLNLL